MSPKGDCCQVNVEDTWCFDCICHADGQKHFSTNCLSQNMIGDGKCDRFCNHQWQDFDGFDCCLDFISPAESCECVSLNQGKAQFSNVHGE